MTPAGIEPATFRFVAQHFNHCATAVPLCILYSSLCTITLPFYVTQPGVLTASQNKPQRRVFLKTHKNVTQGTSVNLPFGLDERGNVGSISPQQRLDRLCGKPGRFHSLLLGGRYLSRW